MSPTNLDTSLVKVFLLSVISFCNHTNLWRPNPPPNSEEKISFSSDQEPRDSVPNIAMWMPPILRNMMHCYTFAEIYVLMCRLCPSILYSPLHSFLVPALTRANAVDGIRLTPVFLFGCFLIYSGTLLRRICYYLLGRNFTFELAVRKDHRLYTDGPYSIVRHPSYTGAFTWIAGLMLCQFGKGSWWIECGMWGTTFGKCFGGVMILLCAIVMASLLTRIKKEDDALRQVFKDQWLSWSQKTPYVLVPYVY